MLFCDAEQIFAVVVFGHWLGETTELVFINPAALVGYLLDTGYLQTLTLLNDLDEGRSLGE